MSVKVAPPSASGDGGAKRGDMYEALKRELEEFCRIGPQVRSREGSFKLRRGGRRGNAPRARTRRSRTRTARARLRPRALASRRASAGTARGGSVRLPRGRRGGGAVSFSRSFDGLWEAAYLLPAARASLDSPKIAPDEHPPLPLTAPSPSPPPAPARRPLPFTPRRGGGGLRDHPRAPEDGGGRERARRRGPDPGDGGGELGSRRGGFGPRPRGRRRRERRGRRRGHGAARGGARGRARRPPRPPRPRVR